MASSEQIIRSQQRTIDKQTEKIRELEDDVYQLRLKQSGGGSAVDEVARQAAYERRELLDRITALETALREVRPMIASIQPMSDDNVKALKGDNWGEPVKWGKVVMVEIRAWIKHGPDIDDLYVGTFPLTVLYSARDAAIKSVSTAIIDILRGSPDVNDISGSFDLDGKPLLSRENLADVCRDLVVYRYVDEYKGGYNNRRNHWFNHYWPVIEPLLNVFNEQQKKRRDRQNRRGIRDKFNKAIDRSFENFEKRRDRPTIPININS